MSDRFRTTDPSLAYEHSLQTGRSVTLQTADGHDLTVRYRDWQHTTVMTSDGRSLATIYHNRASECSTRHAWGHSTHASVAEALAYVAHVWDADVRCESVA